MMLGIWKIFFTRTVLGALLGFPLFAQAEEPGSTAAREAVPTPTATASATASTENPLLQRDIVYQKIEKLELKLDFARPPGSGPFPLVICIHGGGWHSGNKSQYLSLLQDLTQQGFAAASIDYRLSPLNKFPAQLDDVKAAVRFLRAKAQDFQLDSRRFAAWGDSAGGHLALLLALSDSKDKLEGTGPYPEENSRVQAIVNYYGPTDFTAPGPWNEYAHTLIRNLLGTEDQTSPLIARASPITYVSSDDPPVLTFHGAKDTLVPVDQASRLHVALKKAGVEEQLQIIENGQHGWRGRERQRTDAAAIQFLEKHLMPAGK